MLACTLIAIAAAAALSAAVQPTRVGIDVWAERGFAPLAGKRIGLITNHTGRDRSGRLTVERLMATDGLELAAVFSPEHGFLGVEEGNVGSTTDELSGLPVFSLYGETRRPTAEMLSGLEGLVFDIQDIGTRFYTYATTMAYAMEEAAAHGLPFVVLDRPNPITGGFAQGPLLAADQLSFVGYAPIPLRHGMTMGELAAYFNTERGVGADLTVIPVEGWARGDWYDATGLAWVNPSPNMRNLVEAILYPAVGPLGNHQCLRGPRVPMNLSNGSARRGSMASSWPPASTAPGFPAFALCRAVAHPKAASTPARCATAST